MTLKGRDGERAHWWKELHEQCVGWIWTWDTGPDLSQKPSSWPGLGS